MNIFATSSDPVISAKHLDDMRVNKMITESLQMLAVAIDINGGSSSYLPLNIQGAPYGVKGHKNHPCTVWVSKSKYNYIWLIEHLNALLEEWYVRTGKVQRGENNLIRVMSFISYMPDIPMTPFVNCTTHHKHIVDVHAAYRLEMEYKWANKKPRAKLSWYGKDQFPGWN